MRPIYAISLMNLILRYRFLAVMPVYVFMIRILRLIPLSIIIIMCWVFTSPYWINDSVLILDIDLFFNIISIDILYKLYYFKMFKILTLAATAIAAQAASNLWHPPLFMQCNPAWGQDYLG